MKNLWEKKELIKKNNKNANTSKSFQKLGKKNNKYADTSLKTTIDCKPKSKNKNKKLKEIKSKSKQNLIYNTLQNEEDDHFLTIQNSNRANILLKNKSEMNSLFTENNNNEKKALKKQYSELDDQNNYLGEDIKNKDTGIEDNDNDYNSKKKIHYYSKGKYKKKNKSKNKLYYDPLNPYLTN